MMSEETLQTVVTTVTRALADAGYASEPDPANNATAAPAYLKVFCRSTSKSKRVDYLNLVFSETGHEDVRIEGEPTIYDVPGKLNALLTRVRHNLPCD